MATRGRPRFTPQGAGLPVQDLESNEAGPELNFRDWRRLYMPVPSQNLNLPSRCQHSLASATDASEPRSYSYKVLYKQRKQLREVKGFALVTQLVGIQ